MIKILRKLLGSADPDPLVGATFVITGPALNSSDCDALAKHVRNLKMTGCMQFTNRLYIELEVYGPSRSMSELTRRLDCGAVFQRITQYDIKRLPSRSTYSTFHYDSLDVPAEKHP